MYPPGTSLVLKKVPKGGDIINGRFVPEGTRIAHSVWTLMRSKSVFGEDVDIFRPEHWLDAHAERRAEMELTVDLGFGYGRWLCVGKVLAYMELNKVLVEVSRCVFFINNS